MQVCHARAYTHEQQMEYIISVAAMMADEPFKLLIVDSITANLRVDFSGRGELAERQQKLGQMLSRLKKVGNSDLALLYYGTAILWAECAARSHHMLKLCTLAALSSLSWQCGLTYWCSPLLTTMKQLHCLPCFPAHTELGCMTDEGWTGVCAADIRRIQCSCAGNQPGHVRPFWRSYVCGRPQKTLRRTCHGSCLHCQALLAQGQRRTARLQSG